MRRELFLCLLCSFENDVPLSSCYSRHGQDTFHPNLDKGLNIRVNRITRDRKEDEINEAPWLARCGHIGTTGNDQPKTQEG